MRRVGVMAAVLATGLLTSAPWRAAAQPPPLENEITAAESDAPRRLLVKFNEFEGPLGSIRFGGGLLYDYVTYSQDENSRQQFDLEPQWKYRDGRLLLSGRLNFRRQTTWSAGVVYDAAREKWLVRQTGVMFAVTEQPSEPSTSSRGWTHQTPAIRSFTAEKRSPPG